MTGAEARSWLLKRAQERGVDIEVLATTERRLSVEARDGRPSDVSLASSGGIGLRVVQAGRMGYAWSEELSEEALEWALDEAIGNAELQEADSSATLPAGSSLGRHDLLDEALSAPLDAKKNAALELEATLSRDPRLQALQAARYSESQSEVEISSSQGASGVFRSGYGMLMSGIVLREGDSVKQGYSLDLQRGFHSLEPGRTAQQALEEVGRHLGARPLSTGRRRAIFEPEVTGTLLALLSFSVSGKSLVEGTSQLAGRLGQQIASPLVTVVDDPAVDGGIANRPFDSEGTLSRRLVVIEDGVFRSFLHNSDTAARSGQANTGHASRSYRSTLTVQPSNFILVPGAGVTRTEGSVIITDVMGVHAGANPISGDVSVQAMGLEVSGGELVPVDNFAISFNLFELLKKIEEVGTDFEWRPGFSGIIGAASIAVPDVSFGGS